MFSNYDKKIFEEFDDDCRKCIVIIALDESGSMTPNEEVVFQATKQLLQTLAKKNESSLEFEFKVLLMVFNNEVKVINANSIPLPPEQLLELFERNDYSCSGGTSLAAVFRKLDELFSRKENGLLSKSQKGDPFPLVIFISDYIATDSIDSYESAKDTLLSNVFYANTNRLCVYVGAGKNRRSAAAELVGSEDNVLALETNLEALLAPVVIGSAIIASDSSHIGNVDKTPAEIASEQKDKAEKGEQSAELFRDMQLKKQLEEIFNTKQ